MNILAETSQEEGILMDFVTVGIAGGAGLVARIGVSG